MEDYLVRIIAKEAGVRGLACVTTGLANEAILRHEATGAVSIGLARGLSAAALMGALLKVQQRVALKFEGSGLLKKMVVESNSYGKVRGYATPLDETESANRSINLLELFGQNGILTVVKDVRLKELYQGIVPLISGEVDSDLAHYLNHSEQTPSVVELDQLLGDDGRMVVAGGLLVQALPGREALNLDAYVNRIDDLPPLATLLADGKTPEELLALLFSADEYEVLEARPLTFECSCSWERSEKALLLLGRAEIESLIEEQEAIVDCHFCHRRYIFGAEALEMLLEKL